jgi:ureidoglycolate hydrolase
MDYRAKTLKEAFRLCDVQPLKQGGLERFYVDLAAVRKTEAHVRQLMQMVRSAAQTASTRKHDRIMAEDVVYSVKQQQFNFERFLPEDHYPLLAKVCMTKNIDKDEIGQLMLFNTSVLEYNGSDRRNYPNPVVRRSDLFQTALAELTPAAP